MALEEREQTVPEASKVDVDEVAFGSDERVIQVLHPAWTNYLRDIILGVCLLIAGIGLYWLAKAYIKRKTTKYIITTERLIFIEKSVLGARKIEEYELADVERTEIEQSALEARFDVGTVTAYMRHDHHEAEVFSVTVPSVPNHRQVAQTLRSD